MAYDANGNMTSDGSHRLRYDIENRLVGRTGNGASPAVGLAYDPLGRLYQVTGAGGGITRFLYDGDALVVEYDAAGNVLRRYVHGAGADVPLFAYEGADLTRIRQLFADRQGSITAIADGNGQVVSVNAYDEYGIPGSANTGRFQYTGQAWLAELGMYYYKARIYSPTLGRFLQTDPIGYDDQFNLYAYVGDDPVNRVDPDGESWADVAHVALGAASFCPSVCGAAASAVDAAVYVAQGDYGNAAIAAGSAVVGVVSDAGAARLAATGVREGVALVRGERAARGMANPVTRAALLNGRVAHRTLAERAAARGWTANPTGLRANGRVIRPDALTRRGRPIEFKPNTPSGIRRGEQQMRRYEEGTGQRGRVVCYDPGTHRIVPCGR